MSHIYPFKQKLPVIYAHTSKYDQYALENVYLKIMKFILNNLIERASYEDGRLKGDIKNCAGNQGTQITVEDLFYNMPQRKQFFKSPGDEFGRIMDVVCKYAIHNASIGFTLNKQGEGVSLRTPSNSTHCENIRIAYGNNVADDMKSIECEDEHLKFKMFALTSNVKYYAKKFTLLLFINHRLVESTGKDEQHRFLIEEYSKNFVFFSNSYQKRNRPSLLSVFAERKPSVCLHGFENRAEKS